MLPFSFFCVSFLSFCHAANVAILAYSRDTLCIGAELVREYPMSCTAYYPFGSQNHKRFYRYECDPNAGSLALYSYSDSHCSHGSELIQLIHSSGHDAKGECTASGGPYQSAQLLCGAASKKTLQSLMPRLFSRRRVIMRHFGPNDPTCKRPPAFTQMVLLLFCFYMLTY